MVSTPLKNISQLGLFVPIYGKSKQSMVLKPPISKQSPISPMIFHFDGIKTIKNMVSVLHDSMSFPKIVIELEWRFQTCLVKEKPPIFWWFNIRDGLVYMKEFDFPLTWGWTSSYSTNCFLFDECFVKEYHHVLTWSIFDSPQTTCQFLLVMVC